LFPFVRLFHNTVSIAYDYYERLIVKDIVQSDGGKFCGIVLAILGVTSENHENI
jgi:hypothetical protein